MNATSLNFNQIRKNRFVAIEQLKTTIKDFNCKIVILKEMIKEAYLCTPKTYPSKNTSLDNFKTEFWDKYKVELFEQNHINFE